MDWDLLEDSGKRFEKFIAVHSNERFLPIPLLVDFTLKNPSRLSD
jgi:hypothetical protein